MDAGVRADLRGYSGYFSFRAGISPHPHQRNLETAARIRKCHQSLNPQSGETFDQRAVDERLLLQKSEIRAVSTYSSLGGVKVRK